MRGRGEKMRERRESEGRRENEGEKKIQVERERD